MSSIFDYTLNNNCSNTNYISTTNCQLPSPYNHLTSLRNLSTIPGSGPTLLVPQYDEYSLPKSCVVVNNIPNIPINHSSDVGLCLHYSTDELQQFDKSPVLTQQTFNKISTKSNIKWVQDVTPIIIPTLPNPTNINNIKSSNPNLSYSTYDDYLTNTKLPNDNSITIDNERINKTSIIYINNPTATAGSPTRQLLAYDNTSDIAPQCIFNDLSNTNADFTTIKDGSTIHCPTVDDKDILKYTYNSSLQLWLNKDQKNSLNL